MSSLLAMYRPRHEATFMTLRGRTRWICVCGKQMKGWSSNQEEIARSYAEHSGLVEKRK